MCIMERGLCIVHWDVYNGSGEALRDNWLVPLCQL